jgi:hypothetical protein
MKIRKLALSLLSATLLPIGLTLPADAAPGEPYGGCAEAWQAPKSEGAAWCRSRGFTVTKFGVFGPEGWLLSSTLPRCHRVKYGSPCVMNRDEEGNRGFWLKPNGDVKFAKRPALAKHTSRPRGGCAWEFRLPESKGADWCRERGWTITGYFSFDPEGNLRQSVYPACYAKFSGEQECVWDAPAREGCGRSYWTDKMTLIHYTVGKKECD